MGTFGLGGLHRKSTWLYPVATLASLPPTAVDGSVAVLLDTNQGFQYDAAVPGWIPFAGGSGSGARTYNEIPTGLINGVNTAYTTAAKFVAGSEAVHYNGVRLHPGASNDYVISESVPTLGFDTITLAFAPRTGPGPLPDDRVSVDYTV